MPLRHLLACAIIAASLALAAGPVLAQAEKRAPLAGFEAFRERLLADLQRTSQDAATEALAQWILASRNDALRAGVQPMPPAIRTALKGRLPDALLAQVRYRVGDGHDFSLQTNAFKNKADAITLGEVILFRPGRGGDGDVRLWAHELGHVLQYQRWGTRGFARRYTLDRRAVEAEADAQAMKMVAGR